MIQGIMYHDYTIVECEVYRRFKSMESKEIEKKKTHSHKTTTIITTATKPPQKLNKPTSTPSN